MTNYVNLDTVSELAAAAKKVGVPLDGHSIGMIGEAYGARMLGLKRMRASTKGHDAIDQQGNTVEIKATTGTSVAIRTDGEPPDTLAVLKLDRETLKPTLVYYGAAAPAWRTAGKPQKNGQRRISLSQLAALQGFASAEWDQVCAALCPPTASSLAA